MIDKKTQAIIMTLMSEFSEAFISNLLVAVGKKATSLTNIIGKTYSVELVSGLTFTDKITNMTVCDVAIDPMGLFEFKYEITFENEGTFESTDIKTITTKELQEWLFSLENTPIC